MPRDIGNLIWPDVPETPRGRVSSAQGQAITERATTVGFLSAAITRTAYYVFAPENPFGSMSPWVGGIVAFLAVVTWGYLHYRNRGPAGP